MLDISAGESVFYFESAVVKGLGGFVSQSGGIGRLSAFISPASDGFISASDSSQKSGNDPLLDVGAAFYVTDEFSIRALYQRFLDIDDTDVDVVSVGAFFQQ